MIAHKDVETVFSLLEDQDALRARTSFLTRMDRAVPTLSDPVKWIDFNASGGFVRAGISTDPEAGATLLRDPNEDADIARLFQATKHGAIKPGEIKRFADSDSFAWAVPPAHPTTAGAHEVNIRVLYLSYNLVSDVLDIFNYRVALTGAERRVVNQVLAGLSLREAATQDAVSFETKRSQMKAVCLKLDCRSQNDVIRLVLGQLVHLLRFSAVESDQTLVAEDFVADFCPSGAQLRVHRLGDDRLLRVIECGPSRGQPVVLFHSMMFALVLNRAAPELWRHDIRLIMPIRPGYLDSVGAEAPFDPKLVDRFARDMADYVQTALPGPARIIGHSFGTTVALRFAALYPERVRAICLISHLIRQGPRQTRSLYARFAESLARLAVSPRVFRGLAKEFRNRYASPSSFRKALRKVFRHSPADLRALEGTATESPLFAAINASFQSSYAGVADDFFAFYDRMCVDALGDVTHPIQFIHGTEDHAFSLAEVERLARSDYGDRVCRIVGAGQLSHGSHAAEVWHQVANWFSECSPSAARL